jgi:hypothetical protein
MAFTQPNIASVPNVDAITQTLAKLQPDSALQQYAAMHKNDPYILSLATAEANRRKALRTAAQGNPGQPPTVADQEIASMASPPIAARLPENQGIAQLNTPNIQHMADGGIAGYDDSNVPEGAGPAGQLAFNNEPVIRMAGGGHVPRYQGMPKAQGGDGSVVSSLNPMFNIPGMSNVTPRAQFTQAGAPENQTLWEQMQSSLQQEGTQRQMRIIEDRIARGIAGPEEKAYYVQLKTKASGEPVLAPPQSVANPDDALLAAEKAKKFKAATPAPAPAAPAAADANTGGPSLKNASTPMQTGLGNLNTMVGSARNRFLVNANSTIPEDKSIADRLAERQSLMPKGKAMEGYEASVKKEEEAEPEEKKQAGLMALTQGFLAVAAGKSPNALSNLAEGLGVGLKDYGDALKEFKKAGKDRQKQLAEIEHARRAEERGDVDAATKSYETAQEIEQRRRAGIDAGLASLEAHGISGAYSLAGHEIAGKYSLAGHQISANAQKDWMKELKGGQLVENAMKDLRSQIEKSNKYGTPEEKDAAFKTMWPQVLQMNPGLAKYAGGVGGNAMPTGANFVFNPQTGQLEPGK